MNTFGNLIGLKGWAKMNLVQVETKYDRDLQKSTHERHGHHKPDPNKVVLARETLKSIG